MASVPFQVRLSMFLTFRLSPFTVTLFLLALALLSFESLHILPPPSLPFVLCLLVAKGGSPAFASLPHPYLYQFEIMAGC